MIVEVPVIGALALHVLFYVKEGSFSLFELPVKQLQFSPCPFHSIPASIHLDLAGFGKCEPGLAEPEWLCKRDHLTLSLVHSDSSGFKTPYNFMAHQLCFIHRGKESIVIIHVMTGAMNTGLFPFQPLCFAALEPRFMPFLACHNKSIRPSYKYLVECRLNCFALTHEMG